ncbi:MAG: hypothetical protein GY733_24895, partial [bacterium]|nr:hypothetical protein [bacterium]
MDRSLRILRVAPVFYRAARALPYEHSPALEHASYDEQLDALHEWKLVGGRGFVREMNALGHQCREVLYDVRGLQWRWAQEHGLTPSPTRWRTEILLAQIADFKPDVLYFQDIYALDYPTRRDLKRRFPFVKLVVIFRGAPHLDARTARELSTADLLLAGSPTLIERARRFGLEPKLFYHSFDPEILEQVRTPEDFNQREIPFAFAGSSGFGPIHPERYDTLVELAQATPLRLWILDGHPGVGDDEICEDHPNLLRAIPDLPRGGALCIYGSGVAGKGLLSLLRRHRPDVRVEAFADSRQTGTVDGLPLLDINQLRAAHERFDRILVASAYWREILDGLSDLPGSKVR